MKKDLVKVKNISACVTIWLDYLNPQVLEGEGACPPEDVGGIGGYEEFLEAWNDPRHPEHDSVREWGEGMNYKPFNIAHTNELMKDCLKLKKV